MAINVKKRQLEFSSMRQNIKIKSVILKLFEDKGLFLLCVKEVYLAEPELKSLGYWSCRSLRR